jgi:predicted ATPase
MSDLDATLAEPAFLFGPFSLVPAQQLLLDRGAAVRIGTVVGPGGIGKTTVALAAAEALLGAHKHGVWFVDLGPLREHHFVSGALASALELTIRSGDPMTALVTHLRDKQMLIVLDGCEHLVEAAAAFVEQIIGVHPACRS